MIRDFSLVFLLLISDRRNLHRDSRRDTEQNVPCHDVDDFSITVLPRCLHRPKSGTVYWWCTGVWSCICLNGQNKLDVFAVKDM